MNGGGVGVGVLMKVGIIIMTIVSSADHIFLFSIHSIISHLGVSVTDEKGIIRLGTYVTGDKRSRGDDSRGSQRDRDRGSGRESDRRGESSRGDQRAEKEEITKTVIIKGLPAHTTEPSVIRY